VLVPAIAVLFTGGFALSGVASREDMASAHATVIEVDGAGARATSSALVGSIEGGPRVVRMPAGWSPRPPQDTANGGYGPSSSAAVADLTVEPGATVARMDLSGGELRLVQARGPVSGYTDALVVEAATDGRSVTGTVTNRLPVALEQVTVMTGRATTMIGRVEPGASLPFSETGPLVDNLSNYRLSETAWWPVSPEERRYGISSMTYSSNPQSTVVPVSTAPPPPPRPMVDSPVNTALWASFANSWPESLRSPGVVSVVGWTSELPAPFTVEGEGPVRRGRTAVVARTGMAVSALDSVGVRMEQVREADWGARQAGAPVAPVDDLMGPGPVYRVVLPATVGGQPLDPASVVVHAPIDLHRIAVSSARGWKVTREQNDPIAVRLEPGDAPGGVLFVRIRSGDDIKQRPGTNAGPYWGWRFTVGSGDPVVPAVAP
jgi:hypothetical protein